MNKKGFTLIELLAVIVILAIIALIVTPVVSNIISSARKAANARSVEGHVKNIEYAIIEKAFAEGSGDLTIADDITDDTTFRASFPTMPTGDTISCATLVISNGVVKSATGCVVDNVTYNYTEGGGASAVEGSGN